MKYFNLFSNILITKGIYRVLVSDLQRNVSELFPLELYDLTEELKKYSVEELIATYDENSKEIIREYLDIFLQKEYGFLTENDWDKNFPSISLEYDEPSVITEVFIELSDISLFEKIKSSIESLRIKHLIIYSSRALTVENLIKIDHTFGISVLSGIEVFAPFHKDVDQSFMQSLHENTERLYRIVFYNCEKVPFKIKDEFRFTVQFTKESLKTSSCGKVDLKYFNTNISKVSEAINHNSCLHKKIGIDINGNIKNCPLMAESFGNIRDTSLEEAVLKKGFKNYWNITKDSIEVCCDCEFRYVCTDCRAYTERTHKNIDSLDVSKPLKCGYDPYTGKWEAWSKNPLKQTAIRFYEQNSKKSGPEPI